MSLHQFLLEPIICHAWNRDSTEISLSLKIHEVPIYKENRSPEGHELKEHNEYTTVIDWSPKSNSIATYRTDCSFCLGSERWHLEARPGDPED